MNGLLALLALVLAQDPGAEKVAAAAPMPVPKALVAERGSAKISIDGDLQDWPAAPPLLLDDLRQLSGTALTSYRGPSDLAARAFLLWDAEDLFVAVTVRDDWHRRLPSRVQVPNEIPPTDSVVLTFDPERDTRALGRDDGRREDREFWLADVEGGKPRPVLWDRYRGSARWVEGALMAVGRDDAKGITSYEARIPWSEILSTGAVPARGRVLNLQVVVNDYDEVTDPMPQTRVGWTFGAGPYIDPGVMGSIMLMGPLDQLPGELPAFPDPPMLKGDPVPGAAYWVDFGNKLQKTPAVVVSGTVGDAAAAIGLARLDVLETLERHLADFPRVDFLEYQQRIHRRMVRETNGIAQIGLPFFWVRALAELRRGAGADLPERGFRVSRLPQSGWLVRSRAATFAIDPAGQDVERMWDALDFLLLTNPLDMTQRNDQLILRMLASKQRRPVFVHVAFHLPGVNADTLKLAQVGKTYEVRGLRITLLGKQDQAEGLVSTSVGYRVQWPDGMTLVHSGLAMEPSAVEPGASPAIPTDLLLLSARHSRAAEVGRRSGAGLLLLDDILQCSRAPGGDGRVTLTEALTLQTALEPLSSMILAPGESKDVVRTN